MGKPAILIVDGDEALRHSLKGLLLQHGFEVLDAPDNAAVLGSSPHKRSHLLVVQPETSHPPTASLRNGQRRIGTSAPILTIKAYIARVACTDSNALITGAHAVKEGQLQLAHGGTILLDEIGDMSPYARAKILRVIESRQIQRLGGKRSIPLDIRVIAATNQDLEGLMADGKFRKDLPEPFRQRLSQTEGLSQSERERVLSALFATHWNMSKAAQQLHWSRMTLYRKLRKYRIVKGGKLEDSRATSQPGRIVHKTLNLARVALTSPRQAGIGTDLAHGIC